MAPADQPNAPSPLEQIGARVIDDAAVVTTVCEKLKEHHITSVRAVSCLSEKAVTTVCNELKECEHTANLSEGVTESYLWGMVGEANAQLRFAESTVTAQCAPTPEDSGPDQRVQKTRSYARGFQQAIQKYGPFSPEVYPSQKLLDSLRGSGWTYVDLHRYMPSDGPVSRQPETRWAEREDGTVVRVKADDGDDEVSYRAFGSKWCLAYQSLGWAMIINSLDSTEPLNPLNAITLADIDCHRARILALSVQFGWRTASCADIAIRKQIASSEAFHIAPLGEFYLKPELTAGVMLSSLAAATRNNQPPGGKREGKPSTLPSSGPSQKRHRGYGGNRAHNERPQGAGRNDGHNDSKNAPLVAS
ncbi:hypothetical protein FOZ60_008818 [Perkinsus olseni]|uniref:Uncharacterized protein n=1 Tax=Perkinsus olseni TaxID=32597 RepID=A0A7J6NIP0_PEROL|nr:hypothetical protein FOZ60_008818 [Perkinsus olseni]